MDPAEVFIELEPGTTADAAVPPEVRVVQQMPPRLAIVSADEAGIRALEAAPGVSAVFAGDVPPEALERLDVVGEPSPPGGTSAGARRTASATASPGTRRASKRPEVGATSRPT
jgi:hypothetical protein